jgi:hypothetical protein
MTDRTCFRLKDCGGNLTSASSGSSPPSPSLLAIVSYYPMHEILPYACVEQRNNTVGNVRRHVPLCYYGLPDSHAQIAHRCS